MTFLLTFKIPIGPLALWCILPGHQTCNYTIDSELELKRPNILLKKGLAIFSGLDAWSGSDF